MVNGEWKPPPNLPLGGGTQSAETFLVPSASKRLTPVPPYLRNISPFTTHDSPLTKTESR